VKCKIGKESMADEDLVGNIEAVLSSLSGSLKRGMNNVQSVYLKLTMGPSVKLI
jgi:large subunit ribosomal protein L1